MTVVESPRLRSIALDEEHELIVGVLPTALIPDKEGFEELWLMRPSHFHELVVHGRAVKTPRWQQAYGRDYHYTGRINRALPVPTILTPLRRWCVEHLDPGLNGILVNWYDAAHGHYIGRHRDSRSGLRPGAPIVTVSLGATRVFRLRPWRARTKVDVPASNGSLFVMPYATNLAWTHEVPHFARDQGRRISITLRAFTS